MHLGKSKLVRKGTSFEMPIVPSSELFSCFNKLMPNKQRENYGYLYQYPQIFSNITSRYSGK